MKLGFLVSFKKSDKINTINLPWRQYI